MKSQPSRPSIIVVSMWVSTTIASLWMRAARAADDSAGFFFAGAWAPTATAARTTNTTTVFSIMSVSPPALPALFEACGDRHVGRLDVRHDLQHFVRHRH